VTGEKDNVCPAAMKEEPRSLCKEDIKKIYRVYEGQSRLREPMGDQNDCRRFRTFFLRSSGALIPQWMRR